MPALSNKSFRYRFSFSKWSIRSNTCCISVCSAFPINKCLSFHFSTL